jgi:hypothetical protein
MGSQRFLGPISISVSVDIDTPSSESSERSETSETSETSEIASIPDWG